MKDRYAMTMAQAEFTPLTDDEVALLEKVYARTQRRYDAQQEALLTKEKVYYPPPITDKDIEQVRLLVEHRKEVEVAYFASEDFIYTTCLLRYENKLHCGVAKRVTYTGRNGIKADAPDPALGRVLALKRALFSARLLTEPLWEESW